MGLINNQSSQINTKNTLNTSVDKRLNQLSEWLNHELSMTILTIEPASADASFRRYFRATLEIDKPHTEQQSVKTVIVMDAPPDKEPIDSFIAIAQALAKLDIHAPEIVAINQPQGFLLLEDLGNRTYLDELHKNADSLYNDAIDALIKLQSGKMSPVGWPLPSYDATKLEEEMDLFTQWYMNRHLGQSLSKQQQQSWSALKHMLIATCQEQPQVWVHRDYHSRNLMITEDQSPGVIDFQDMVVGPISYDLASLFKDCYIEWPRAQQLNWLASYQHKAQTKLNINFTDSEQLIRWFDLTGLQRHLKVLGIFCRLYYRDGKEQYLNDLPLVAKYVLDVFNHCSALNDAALDDFALHFRPCIERALGDQPLQLC